jgi:hypothetical protein
MRSTDFPFAVTPQRLQRGGKLSVDYTAPSADVADLLDPTDIVGRGRLEARETSWRDKLKDELAVRFGRRNAEQMLTLADFTPLGGAFVGNEAALAAREGKRGEAAANVALAALPIPGAGKAAKKVAKAAAPKQLALPAPGPGLPKFAAKPRGGQFWADKNIGAMRQSDLGVKMAKLPDTDTWAVRDEGGKLKLFGNEDEARAYVNRVVSEANPNISPENAVRRIADDALRLAPDADGPLSQLKNWFNKTAPKYLKSDFGTPEDPMRALAESGSLHVGLSPDEWSEAAKKVLKQQTIGDVIGLNAPFVPQGAFPGAGDDYRANVLLNMPWLEKAPVTDKLYGIANTRILQDQMGMSHLLDEMKNALDPRSGLPPELLLRPESLSRMSLPAAAERVNRINQFRVKEMERAALGNLDSPAVQTFKEYPENNPMGLRWVELRAPSEESGLFKIVPAEEQGVPFHFVEDIATGERTPIGGTREDALRQAQQMYGRDPLQDALKYEGDTMGHCVGGYCDYVMAGHSRVFSLRDAKGEPHVTIETAPTRRSLSRDEANAINRQVSEEIRANPELKGLNEDEQELFFRDRQDELVRALLAKNPSADDIVQIKGKQNRAPKDDYLPFVQDFVKSGQWGNVGDLRNARLVKLPDGRYITQQQADEGIAAMTGTRIYSNEALQNLTPEEWAIEARHFEGYAVGGRVSADRCFSRNPMSVKKARGGGMAVKYGC